MALRQGRGKDRSKPKAKRVEGQTEQGDGARGVQVADHIWDCGRVY